MLIHLKRFIENKKNIVPLVQIESLRRLRNVFWCRVQSRYKCTRFLILTISRWSHHVFIPDDSPCSNCSIRRYKDREGDYDLQTIKNYSKKYSYDIGISLKDHYKRMIKFLLVYPCNVVKNETLISMPLFCIYFSYFPLKKLSFLFLEYQVWRYLMVTFMI